MSDERRYGVQERRDSNRWTMLKQVFATSMALTPLVIMFFVWMARTEARITVIEARLYEQTLRDQKQDADLEKSVLAIQRDVGAIRDHLMRGER